MNWKLSGLVALAVMAVPGLAPAENVMTPWGAMNEFGPWDSSDVARQRYQASQPHYPTRPLRKPRLLREFSRPINHASVDIQARLPETPVHFKKLKGNLLYNIQIGVLTPEYQAMSVVAYPARMTPSPKMKQLDLNCDIESIRRWDKGGLHGWSVRIAATFLDQGTSELLDRAKTVLISHGVCYPVLERRGQLAPQGVYEFHAAFVSQFEDTDEAAAMMEIGTGLHFNTVGNGYFERPRVLMAFTGTGPRDEIRIKYR